MKASTKSIIFFMIVYVTSMGILASTIGYQYYGSEKRSLVEKLRLEMRYKIKSINAKLEYYHKYKYEDFIFYEEGYDIALYDNKADLIASNFVNDSIDFTKLFYEIDNQYYLIDSLYNEYLDVKYIVVRKSLDQEALNHIMKQIIVTAGSAFIFLLFVAFLLSKSCCIL